MKKTLLLLALFISFAAMAQVPQGISYQAIALNGSGNPVINSTVGVRLSILDNSASGTVLYTETHVKMTDAQGLFNTVIGQGTVVTGTFASINWGKNSKFLKVEMDVAGGTTYVLTGTTQLLSAPYALYAEKINTANIPGLSTAISSKNGTEIVVYTSTNAYGFTDSGQENPTWYATPISGTVLGAIATDVSVVVYTSTNAYAFMKSGLENPTWYSTPISGTPIGATASGNVICVYTATNAYGFCASGQANPTWYSNPISGTVVGAVGGGTNSVVVYTSSNAYGFTRSGLENPTWYSTPISGAPLGASSSGKFIVVYTGSNAYGFTTSGLDNPTWYATPISGTPLDIIPK